MSAKSERPNKDGLFARVPIAAIVDRELTDGEVRALAGICAFMRRDNYAWPSQELLGMTTRRVRGTANRNVRKLERLGHITLHRYRHHDGSMRVTYQVNFKPTLLPKRLSWRHRK